MENEPVTGSGETIITPETAGTGTVKVPVTGSGNTTQPVLIVGAGMVKEAVMAVGSATVFVVMVGAGMVKEAVTESGVASKCCSAPKVSHVPSLLAFLAFHQSAERTILDMVISSITPLAYSASLNQRPILRVPVPLCIATYVPTLGCDNAMAEPFLYRTIDVSTLLPS